MNPNSTFSKIVFLPLSAFLFTVDLPAADFTGSLSAILYHAVGGAQVANYSKSVADQTSFPYSLNVASGTLAAGDYVFSLSMQAGQNAGIYRPWSGAAFSWPPLAHAVTPSWYYFQTQAKFKLAQSPSNSVLTGNVAPVVAGVRSNFENVFAVTTGLNNRTRSGFRVQDVALLNTASSPVGFGYTLNAPKKWSLRHADPYLDINVFLNTNANLWSEGPPSPYPGFLSLQRTFRSPWESISEVSGSLGFDNPTSPSSFSSSLIWPNYIAGTGTDLYTSISFSWRFTLTQPTAWNWQMGADNPIPGASPTTPILPVPSPSQTPGSWILFSPRGRWCDPPAVWGYRYTMRTASTFTKIMDFPPGFPQKFKVQAPGMTTPVLRGPGQEFSFTTLNPAGVTTFDVTGIDSGLDPSNPKAFPLQLDFSTPTAEFSMEAIAPPTNIVIPPASVQFSESATDRFLHFTGKLKRSTSPAGPWEILDTQSPLRSPKLTLGAQREFFTAEP